MPPGAVAGPVRGPRTAPDRGGRDGGRAGPTSRSGQFGGWFRAVRRGAAGKVREVLHKELPPGGRKTGPH
ncbi:predicted protein [Streptomyces viridosporus ATCC 14672]|uniref:Predicted protein n=1 Tax=Streptomyces viridosporus (strain ATCC 14672 / DSM 40746 / JCM 4963 / KCTC 9882 / NRRL B-12104 / FH 1290) TaxID=566461 RepID=D5ZXU1_STRV1|nr:predicted protein [Streptomyces viridosporus ATCC 14672]